jgi:hypothetical protein
MLPENSVLPFGTSTYQVSLDIVNLPWVAKIPTSCTAKKWETTLIEARRWYGQSCLEFKTSAFQISLIEAAQYWTEILVFASIASLSAHRSYGCDRDHSSTCYDIKNRNCCRAGPASIESG